MALLGLAVVMVHSASLSVGDGGADLRALATSRHTLFAGAAVLAMLVASKVNLVHFMRLRGLLNPIPMLLLAALALTLMTRVPGLGHTAHGATRWLHIPIGEMGFTFQPSELLKFALVLAVAWWCARSRGVMHQFGAGLAPALVVVALVCGAVAVDDLGTAALIGLVACIVLVAGGARVWHLAMLSPIAAIGGVGFILAAPYRMQRVTTFLDPFSQPDGSSYQIIQGLVAIAEGGTYGRGLGQGVQKFDYLPTDTSDMLFAIICEELGLVGAAAVMALLLVVLWTGLVLLIRSRDAFSRLVATGVLATVGLQALFNIAVVTVVVPTKGIALPLLSAGGTGWIVTAAALGLVASLEQAPERDVDPEAGGIPDSAREVP